MNITKPAGFVWPFVSGFAIGAVALVGIQLSQPGVSASVAGHPVTIEQVR